MFNFLTEWLQKEEQSTELLIEWLQGYKLPPFGNDYEPYLWLLRSLEVAKADKLKELFAEKLAKILLKKPDIIPIGKHNKKLLYNLLLCCSGLNYPKHLAFPLREMLQRKKLNGRWQEIDLCHCLFLALAENHMEVIDEVKT